MKPSVRTVFLWATIGLLAGCTEQLDGPVAVIAGPDTASVGEVVVMDGSDSHGPGGGSLSFQWGFRSLPAGSMAAFNRSTLENPSFVPDLAGTYTVTLVVDNGRTSSRMAVTDVEVTVSECGSHSPVATLTALPTEQVAGQRVVLDAEVVDADQWDGTPEDTCRRTERFRYEWAIAAAPEGSLAEIDAPNAPRTSFTPDLSGTYRVECLVLDEAGHRSDDQPGAGDVVVTVEVSPDTSPHVIACEATPDYGIAPMQVELGCQIEGGEEPFAWSWSFGNGVTSTERSPVHTYTVAGEYAVTLRVTDGNGDVGMGHVGVQVLEDSTPQVAIAADPAVGEAPAPIDFPSAWAGGNEPLSFRWDFGDGATATGTTDVTPGLETRGHTFNAAGTYLVALSATDADGDVGLATTQVVVTPAGPPADNPPVADAGQAACVFTGASVALDGRESHDPDDTTGPAWDQLTFDWYLLDVPPGSQAQLNASTVVGPSFTPDVDGEYLVRLVVSDGVHSASDTVLIEASSRILLQVVGDDERFGDAGDSDPVSEPLRVSARNDCQSIAPIDLPDVTIRWEAENAGVESLGTETATSDTDAEGVATIAAFFGESAEWGVVHARPDEACAAPCSEAVFQLNALCESPLECEGGACDLGADTPICIGPWHVDATATGRGDGKTWRDAFADLADALGAADAGQQIWVAGGTYRPGEATDSGDPRAATFSIDRPLEVVGGFEGHELFLDDRPELLAETILSGDLGDDVHCFHVVTVTADDVSIDGFAIDDGLALDPEHVEIEAGGGLLALGVTGLAVRDTKFSRNSATNGGGVFGRELSESTFERCVFEQNSAANGAGMMLEDCADTVEIIDTDFFDNQGHSRGGGLYLDDSPIVVDGGRFEGNRADDQSGGAVVVDGEGSAPWLTNCVFVSNTAQWHAGAIAVYGTANSPVITHSIFYKNRFFENPSLYHVHAYTDNTPLFVNDIFDDGVVYVPAGAVHFSVVRSWSAGQAEPCVDGDPIRGCWDGRATCVDGYCDTPTNLTVAPAFVCQTGTIPDPCEDDGDFHFIGGDSPGVDDGVREHEGVDYCSPTDRDGVVRPQPAGGACDMGAYEWEGEE